MADHIAEIIKHHIALEQKKLAALEAGVSLEWYSDIDGRWSTTRESVQAAIDGMEDALARHMERQNAHRT